MNWCRDFVNDSTPYEGPHQLTSLLVATRAARAGSPAFMYRLMAARKSSSFSLSCFKNQRQMICILFFLFIKKGHCYVQKSLKITWNKFKYKLQNLRYMYAAQNLLLTMSVFVIHKRSWRPRWKMYTHLSGCLLLPSVHQPLIITPLQIIQFWVHLQFIHMEINRMHKLKNNKA